MENKAEQPNGGRKLELDYPCSWQYKVISSRPEPVQDIVKEYMGDEAYSLTESNRSSGGRYTSYNLEITANSDEHRLGLHELLSNHPDIKAVL